jgi:hypothetical protein
MEEKMSVMEMLHSGFFVGAGMMMGALATIVACAVLIYIIVRIYDRLTY